MAHPLFEHADRLSGIAIAAASGVKAAEGILPRHNAQLSAGLERPHFPPGRLINFHVTRLTAVISRLRLPAANR